MYRKVLLDKTFSPLSVFKTFGNTVWRKNGLLVWGHILFRRVFDVADNYLPNVIHSSRGCQGIE